VALPFDFDVFVVTSHTNGEGSRSPESGISGFETRADKRKGNQNGIVHLDRIFKMSINEIESSSVPLTYSSTHFISTSMCLCIRRCLSVCPSVNKYTRKANEICFKNSETNVFIVERSV